MKKVYEAPEFLSEDVLTNVSTISDLDNTESDPFANLGGDEEATEFVLS